MSKILINSRPADNPKVDLAFDALRQAIIPALASLSREQQIAVENLLREQIDKTHQAVLEQINTLTETSSAGAKSYQLIITPEFFDESAYQEKLQRLLSYGEEVRYEGVKNLPRTAEWRSMPEVLALKHKLGKFFKMMMIWAKNQTTGKEWTQGIVVQEFEQYDKHACNKEIGKQVLPIRFVNGEILAAITVRNFAGSFGKTMFTVPRASNSNEDKTIFYNMSGKLHEEYQRPDAGRLTGKLTSCVLLVPEQTVQQINHEKEKIVWFTIPELKHLLEEPQSEDSPTLAIARWLLLNAADLQSKFQSNSG